MMPDALAIGVQYFVEAMDIDLRGRLAGGFWEFLENHMEQELVRPHDDDGGWLGPSESMMMRMSPLWDA